MKKLRKLLLLITMLTLTLSFPLTSHAAVKINKKSLTLTKTQTATLKISGTKKKIKWSSSKKSVASVSSKGKVTAKKKGTAVITAKIGNKKYTCKVTVRNPLTAANAKKAVKKFLSKKNFGFYFNSIEKSGKNYIIWVTYTGPGMKSKFIVNSITGNVCSYAPYIGINMPAGPSVACEYTFNAYKYL